MNMKAVTRSDQPNIVGRVAMILNINVIISLINIVLFYLTPQKDKWYNTIHFVEMRTVKIRT